MVHTYQITGMTCTSCEEKVKSALLKMEHVTAVVISLEDNSATITMDKHISMPELQNALENKYQLSAPHHNETVEQTKSWFATILFCFFLLLLDIINRYCNLICFALPVLQV